MDLVELKANLGNYHYKAAPIMEELIIELEAAEKRAEAAEALAANRLTIISRNGDTLMIERLCIRDLGNELETVKAEVLRLKSEVYKRQDKLEAAEQREQALRVALEGIARKIRKARVQVTRPSAGGPMLDWSALPTFDLALTEVHEMVVAALAATPAPESKEWTMVHICTLCGKRGDTACNCEPATGVDGER